MARVKGALNARKKHKKVLKLARGYRGARSKQYRVAKQSVMKAMAFAFSGRKQTKREYRSLWITRINAAARMNAISYSKLIHGLRLADVNINRKMLADLAVSDPAAFTTLVNTAKAKL
ncbi:50S ribosomal protein L20 [Anaerotignum sp. MB30-C6]|uniref:50S ribosomal protein L20 n=1 Tax=Anaerotignum sp. MB30-C6 TaxID=3070814 RepID=UPI0027DAF4F6|nr:50S ribosomal protein L20 [Anaerotignum sp. MB30-C6]WMI80112.1 50S ribosomal protein L20 [Anaerotignum sp. MB30-C6]